MAPNADWRFRKCPRLSAEHGAKPAKDNWDCVASGLARDDPPKLSKNEKKESKILQNEATKSNRINK
jgi:hypothetical protein